VPAAVRGKSRLFQLFSIASHRSRLRRCGAVLAALPAISLICGEALAHTGEGGFVLLLPTGYYLLGGTAVVAASFLLIALIPGDRLRRRAEARWTVVTLPGGNWARTARSCANGLASLLLVLLLLIGCLGNTDPLDNLLPLTIWTVWWVGLVVLQAICGNLWSWLNPWILPGRALHRLIWRGGGAGARHYPVWLGYWPASLAFLAFAWFELIYPAPADPLRLAIAGGFYSLWTILGIACFGADAWLSRAEPFSNFLALVGRLSPVMVTEQEGKRVLQLGCPGARLLELEPLPASGVVFLLLVLAAVSFDGLGSTFWWLGLGGINPLEFPGRSAVIGFMTLGLIAAWLALTGLYFAAIWLGERLAGGRSMGSHGDPRSVRRLAGSLVISIMPIAVAYHVAHYLTDFLVNIQDVWVSISDPFEREWDLFGTAGDHVSTALLSNYDSVRVIWNIEAGAIVLGHILAVAMAHMAMRRLVPDRAAARAREVPLAILMVFYTLFGLWLLATPHAG
jgi:hypothetical protein